MIKRNTDAKRIISEQAKEETIQNLVDAMKALSEQLEYLIEILE